MKKTLDKKWQDKLAGLPEAGMGYQRVTVIFADGGVREDVLVVNGQECELPDGDAGREIKDIRASGGLEANWIEEEPPVMNEAERRRRIRKKIDDAILALPKPVHVETLMSSGKEPKKIIPGEAQERWMSCSPSPEGEMDEWPDGLYRRGEACPQCGSTKSSVAIGGAIRQWWCQACGNPFMPVDTTKKSASIRVLARLNNLISSLGITGYTMRQIMDDVDDGSESRSRRCGSSLSKFDKKNGVAEFSSVCTAGSHRQRISFNDWETIVELATEDEETDFDKLEGTALFGDPVVGDLLKESDVIVFCSCPSYKFSFAYLCYTLSMGELGEAHDAPPNIRNPELRGTVCKHLISVYNHYFK